MPKIDGFELSISELEMAEDMGLEDYVNYDDDKSEPVCEQCGRDMSPCEYVLGDTCKQCCKKNHQAVAGS